MKMEGGNPSVLSKFSSSKRNGSNTMHNFQSLFYAETGAECGLALGADGLGAFRHTSSCSRNLSERSPSILLRKTVLPLKSPTGAFIAPLHCANANNVFLLCTKSYIVCSKIVVWCSFYWESVNRKSLKLLVPSRSFRLF